MELAVNGVTSDGNDIYESPLPDDVIPKQIQEIINNDNKYREYLLDERSFYELIMDSTQNSILINLLKTARVYEENLMLKMDLASSNDMRLSNTTPGMTTKITTSITMQNSPSKRKGSVFQNVHGKDFAKRCKSQQQKRECYNKNYGFVTSGDNDSENDLVPSISLSDFLELQNFDIPVESNTI